MAGDVITVDALEKLTPGDNHHLLSNSQPQQPSSQGIEMNRIVLDNNKIQRNTGDDDVESVSDATSSTTQGSTTAPVVVEGQVDGGSLLASSRDIQPESDGPNEKKSVAKM
jgi:hypothetical protein